MIGLVRVAHYSNHSYGRIKDMDLFSRNKQTIGKNDILVVIELCIKGIVWSY